MSAHTRRTLTELQMIACMARPAAPNHDAGEAALTAYIQALPVSVVDVLEVVICQGWAALQADALHVAITAILHPSHSRR